MTVSDIAKERERERKRLEQLHKVRPLLFAGLLYGRIISSVLYIQRWRAVGIWSNKFRHRLYCFEKFFRSSSTAAAAAAATGFDFVLFRFDLFGVT